MAFKMKYSIKKQYLTSGSLRRSGTKAPSIEFMVAHDTGNPGSTASNNVGYYENSRNDMSASAHIFVDDKEIIECIPLLTAKPEKAWHVIYNVTTDNRMYGDDANDVAGGVELCWGSGINSKEAYKRYIWVLAYACYKFKLNPATDIVGHDVLDPKRKIDPTNGLKYMGIGYQEMLNDVVKEYNNCVGKTAVKPATPVTGSTYTIKSGDTLWGIAQRSKGAFDVQDLISWNPGIKPAKLKVGQKINLKKPASSSKKPANSGSSSSSSKNDILVLPSDADTWTVYKLNKPAVKANKDNWAGQLSPSKYGGLKYEILEYKSKYVAVIQTRDYGKVKIYIHPKEGAKVIKGSSSNSSGNKSSSSKKTSSSSSSLRVPNKLLVRGDKGKDVLDMQKALSSVYFYPDKGAKNNGCDGDYGPKTENCVRRFQMMHMSSKDVDGKFGPKTRAALIKAMK